MPRFLPRRSYPSHTPVRWPKAGMLQFPLGLDTLHAVEQVPLGALRVCQNVELDKRGAVRHRSGRTAYGAALAGPSLGDYELVRRNGTRYLLRVYNGQLYSSTDDGATWTQIPIRLYAPYPAYADDNTVGERLNGSPLSPAKERASGAVGANVAASTTYEYAVLAVKGANKTTLSDVAQVTTDAAPNPIDLNFHAAYKADTYEIWRRTGSGGTWGQMATGVTAVTTGGKTLVQWADDGSIAPNTAVTPPAANTTEHTLPAAAKVDWETDAWGSDNAAYFVAGDGICRTNGTIAEIVTPTSPATYLEQAAGLNALGDHTWAGHKGKGIIRHHAYLFVTGSDDAPHDLFWGRADDPGHMPQLGRIRIPRALGGNTLDFAVKDDKLIVGMTTGIWVLFGRIFNPTGPDSSVYFKQLSDFGVASARSMKKPPNGWIIYLASDKSLRAIVNVEGTTDAYNTVELAEAIRPTLASLTDHANAAAVYNDGQYWIVFPADQKAVRLYLFENEVMRGAKQSTVVKVAPVLDTQRPFRNFLVRQDGTLLAADDTTGRLWRLNYGPTDDVDAIPMELETPPLDLGDPWAIKGLQRMILILGSVAVDEMVSVTLLGDLLTSGMSVKPQEAPFWPGDVDSYPIDVYEDSRWWVIRITSSSTVAERIMINGLITESVYRTETA